MERLLAYGGPVVHVDHSHRAPAPTSWSCREDEDLPRLRRENAALQNQVNNQTEKLENLSAEWAQKLEEQRRQLTQRIWIDEQEKVKKDRALLALQRQLDEDDKNYTKLLQGVSKEAKSKFVFEHAMTVSKAEKGDEEALQYIKWLQTKLAALLGDEAAAKIAVGGDKKWF